MLSRDPWIAQLYEVIHDQEMETLKTMAMPQVKLIAQALSCQGASIRYLGEARKNYEINKFLLDNCEKIYLQPSSIYKFRYRIYIKIY